MPLNGLCRPAPALPSGAVARHLLLPNTSSCPQALRRCCPAPAPAVRCCGAALELQMCVLKGNRDSKILGPAGTGY